MQSKLLIPFLLSASFVLADVDNVCVTTKCSNSNDGMNAQMVKPKSSSCGVQSGISANLEFIFWNSSFTDSRITAATSSSNVDGVLTSFQNKFMEFDWNPGFKVGVDAVLKYDEWHPSIEYTFLSSRAKKTWNSSSSNLMSGIIYDYFEASSSDTSFSPLVEPLFLGSAASKIHAKWKLDYNVFNLQLGKKTFISNLHSLEPFAALKFGVINSNLKVDFSGLVNKIPNATVASNIPSGGPGPFNVERSNHAWVVGPRFGANAHYKFYKEFAFRARGATSVLSIFDNPKEIERAYGNDASEIGKATYGRRTTFAPHFDLYLGLDWNYCYENIALIDVGLGYEFNHYSNVIDKTRSLNLNGANLSLKVSY